MDGPRPFHLPQDLLVVVLVLEAELVDNSPEVGVSGGLEQLLQPDQALVVLQEDLKGKGLSVHLVKDGEALPAKGLDQSHVSFRDQPWAWVKVD